MYLRTTQSATNNTMLEYILSSQSKYNELAVQASSQKKINTPSDNPVDAMNVLNVNKQLSQLNGYLNNMAMSNNELAVMDNTFGAINKSLQRLSDIGVQASNGTNNPQALQNMKIEVDQIIKNITSLGNTQFNGAYLFSGTNTATQPFTEIPTGGVQYNGTPQNADYQRYIQIAEGVTVPINVPGDQLLGSYDAATDTGTGMMKTLYQFSNALGATPPNFDTIRSNIDKIKSSIDNTSSIRTNFASITSRFDMTKNSIDTNILQLKSYKSNLEDLDLAEAVTKLSQQELALKATMAVSSQMMQQVSLLNYM